MYVQEYGPACPEPNTGRTYISYLDSVRYLQTSPPDQRTPVYHAVINGYIADARERGFVHAHIWVAPPQAGDEYIFHCHPEDRRHKGVMSMNKLREWYVRMLDAAQADGVVKSYEDIQDHVQQLTSIRDFPLFEGDFFPDYMKSMPITAAAAPPPPGAAAPPGLRKQESVALAASLKNKTKQMRKRFLVATLQPKASPPARGARARGKGAAPPAADADADAPDDETACELVDKRMDFLKLSTDRHWEWSELRRAHYASMMVLAYLGGAPS